jgi:hypothetical protein
MTSQLAGGTDPEEMDSRNAQIMDAWLEKRGLVLTRHARPVNDKRWVGVVTSTDAYSDHCLLMNGRDCLHDPASLLGSLTASQYNVSEIDYAITFRS